MTKVSIALSDTRPGSRFDADYYVERAHAHVDQWPRSCHQSRVRGNRCERCAARATAAVRRAVSLCLRVGGRFYNDIHAACRGRCRGDMINYTDIEPIIQISEIEDHLALAGSLNLPVSVRAASVVRVPSPCWYDEIERSFHCIPIVWHKRKVPICCNTRTIRWIGIPGARRPSNGRVWRTSRSSFPSATPPATGATSWSARASRTKRSPR